tara:strand:+ start:924 stop:1574 length:651 start_codon:yes stop_codon:yes gene_type:complete
MAFTYAELKTAIQDYTDNTETSFVNNLPVFIRLAEEKILKEVQLTVFRKNAKGTMSQGNKFLTLPDDFLSPFSLTFITATGEQNFLLFKDVDFVQTYTPNEATQGEPRYFAQFDDDAFILAPTPNANLETELHYFYRPASLTAGAESGTTYLSKNAELTLLYGALIEAYIYMKGDPQLMADYEKRFVQSLGGLKMFGENKQVTDQYRSGMIIRPAV